MSLNSNRVFGGQFSVEVVVQLIRNVPGVFGLTAATLVAIIFSAAHVTHLFSSMRLHHRPQQLSSTVQVCLRRTGGDAHLVADLGVRVTFNVVKDEDGAGLWRKRRYRLAQIHRNLRGRVR